MNGDSHNWKAGCIMAATIETVKEKAEALHSEICALLDEHAESLDDEDHDFLIDLEADLSEFLGIETEEETPE